MKLVNLILKALLCTIVDDVFVLGLHCCDGGTTRLNWQFDDLLSHGIVIKVNLDLANILVLNGGLNLSKVCLRESLLNL
jgi:hypothetical protein